MGEEEEEERRTEIVPRQGIPRAIHFQSDLSLSLDGMPHKTASICWIPPAYLVVSSNRRHILLAITFCLCLDSSLGGCLLECMFLNDGLLWRQLDDLWRRGRRVCLCVLALKSVAYGVLLFRIREQIKLHSTFSFCSKSGTKFGVNWTYKFMMMMMDGGFDKGWNKGTWQVRTHSSVLDVSRRRRRWRGRPRGRDGSLQTVHTSHFHKWEFCYFSLNLGKRLVQITVIFYRGKFSVWMFVNSLQTWKFIMCAMLADVSSDVYESTA